MPRTPTKAVKCVCLAVEVLKNVALNYEMENRDKFSEAKKNLGHKLMNFLTFPRHTSKNVPLTMCVLPFIKQTSEKQNDLLMVVLSAEVTQSSN